jgi:hypothetical protein
MIKKHGEFFYRENRIALLDQPYISDDGENYLANGVDIDDNDYQLSWDIISHEEDDLDCCDWTDYSIVRSGYAS